MNERQGSPLRFAIVGCGAITQIYYVPALHDLIRAGIVEVAVLVDPAETSIAAVAQHYPNAIRVTRLADAPSVDAAIIASPASLHAEQANYLLGRGTHVLCEKPMATTLEQCESMVAAARSAQRLLAVGLFRRFFPGAAQMRELVVSEALGAVREFVVVEGNRFQWQAKTDAFFRKSTGGGGVLLDIGVHALDLVLWWFGEPEDVACEDDAIGGVEANCRIACVFPGGFHGTVRLSRDVNLPNRYLVLFERGWAAWSPSEPQNLDLGVSEHFALSSRVHEAARWMGRPALGPIASNYYESFIAQLENFVDAVRGSGSPVVSGDEGLRSIRLIESCYRGSRLMAMPWLTTVEARAAEDMRC